MNALPFEQITSEQFMERIIEQKADALVKVSTSVNAASQLLCRTLQELSTHYSDRINFFQLDHEMNASLTASYLVDRLPTLLFFKNGTLVDRLSGLTHRSIISGKLNQLLTL